jgi:hypothetical protein
VLVGDINIRSILLIINIKSKTFHRYNTNYKYNKIIIISKVKFDLFNDNNIKIGHITHNSSDADIRTHGEGFF